MTSLAIRLKELDSDELEEFVEVYANHLGLGYDSVIRLGTANDKGRDVVGFLTSGKHDGAWDLYQCKRKTHGSALGVPEALCELGKVFFHHCDRAYGTLPAKYIFVAPRGIAGPLRDLILNPSTLEAGLVARWDECCARGIVAGKVVALSDEIRAAIAGYGFGKVSYRSTAEIVKDPAAKVALSVILGLKPEDPPLGDMHPDVQDDEMEYAGQLRFAYDEARGRPFASLAEIQADARHGPHFRDQRERFFAATWFERTYRDSTAPAAFESFRKDVYHGSIDVHRRDHASALARVDAVMENASKASASFAGSDTRSYVRQGVWHRFVNEGEIRWTP